MKIIFSEYPIEFGIREKFSIALLINVYLV
jgi:hypothetical protein